MMAAHCLWKGFHLRPYTPPEEMMTSLLRVANLLALFPVALTLSGCGILPTGPHVHELREMERNRRLWEAQGITNYGYQVQNFSFWPDEYRGPVAVEVRDSRTVSAVYVDGGAPARPEPFASMDTIEDLFDTIARALARRPDEAVIVYDPQLGYPRSARFDFERNVTDEEGGFSVSSFQPQ